MLNRKRTIIIDSEEEGHAASPPPRHRKRAATRRPTIFINDSDSSDTLDEESDENLPGRARNVPSAFNAGDYMTDDDLPAFLRRLKFKARSAPQLPRQLPTETILEEFSSKGKIYRRGKTVELVDLTFLRIHTVIKINEGVFLRGYRFRRCELMGGLVPKRANELCWVVELTAEEAASGLTSKITQVPLTDVKHFRLLRLTNHQYSDMSNKTTGLPAHEGYLFCRLKYFKIWETARKKAVEEAVVSLSVSDTDKGYGSEEDALREGWRGTTVRGGSHRKPVVQDPPVIDLDPVDLSTRNNVPVSMPVARRRQYSFGDGFCGAGGVSCGARQAGLWIAWGFDKSQNAMQSYRLNFQDAMGETSDVADFLTNSPKDIIVDIIHASPPCQTFSPAHTVMAETDEANEACIFSVRQIIERGKPRIFTMEETSGLQERHEQFLHATIHTLVELGYSIRWKQLNCSGYGVPQNRRRLVVIASGPGETLPPFPKPTHGAPESNLRPLNTIGSAISTIPLNAPNHDINSVSRPDPPKRPYPPNTLAKTITCGGGENYHPSGLRGFTTREFASLQTFPVSHQFGKVETRKQIGNAVPPMLARALYREIIKSLEKTDGLR